MTSINVTKEIDKALEESTKRLRVIGDRYRQAVLLPYCRKHKLTFKEVNGTIYFIPSKKLNGRQRMDRDGKPLFITDTSCFDYLPHKYRGLTKIFSDLNLEVFYNNMFASFVPEIAEEDLE